MAPEAPTLGIVEPGLNVVLGERRRDAAEQIEDQELHVPEAVLDVVAEDPQVQHVAAEVQPAAVHEHGGENGRDVGPRMVREAPRHEGPFVDELVAVLQLQEEDQHVDGNEDVGDVRRRAPQGVVIADRKHLSALHLSGKTCRQ